MRRIIYPQFVFTREIKKKINQLFTKGNSLNTVLDCPCGSGITTINLAKWFPKVDIIGVDIDKEAIDFAKSNYYSENLTFFQDDILNYLKKSGGHDIICLINSLFLFDNPSAILSQIKANMVRNGRLYIIIPNIEGKNFKIFQKTNPDVNKFLLHESEIRSYFENLNFKLDSVEPICFVHHFNRIESGILRYFFNHYLLLINFINKIFRLQKGNYFLIGLEC